MVEKTIVKNGFRVVYERIFRHYGTYLRLAALERHNNLTGTHIVIERFNKDGSVSKGRQIEELYDRVFDSEEEAALAIDAYIEQKYGKDD